jgi:hypothetical protein
MSSKRFRVSSEGRTEDGKRACGRRYHSSGTQNRNVGFWREFAKDDRMRSDNTDEDEIFEANKEVYNMINEQYIEKQYITLTAILDDILEVTSSGHRQALSKTQVLDHRTNDILYYRIPSIVYRPNKPIMNLRHTRK